MSSSLLSKAIKYLAEIPIFFANSCIKNNKGWVLDAIGNLLNKISNFSFHELGENGNELSLL
jgi:hypothetical protein